MIEVISIRRIRVAKIPTKINDLRMFKVKLQLIFFYL